MMVRSGKVRIGISVLAGMLAILWHAGAYAQIGTAFTYQGDLDQSGSPASGSFDFHFSVWDQATLGVQQGSTIEFDTSGLGTITVTNGLFTATLDFGSGIFPGDPRWLEISVRDHDPGDSAPYTLLTPRVELAPVPYALFATTALNVINDAVDDADANPANELQSLSAMTAGSNRTINITGGTGATFSINDADSDPTNELISTFEFSAPTILTLKDAGNQFDLDVSGLIDDADADPTNEIQNLSTITVGSNRTITITGGTGTTFSVNDADADPANELDDRPPVAVLEADMPFAIDASLLSAEITFRMDLSYDPEGGALTHGFDFEGDQPGEPASYGASATATHTYTEAGTYLVEGWARDGSSQYDLDRVIIDVVTGAVNTDADSTGFITGQFSSLAVVNSNPAIAYRDTSGNELRYVRATTATGSAWGVPVTVDTSVLNTGHYISLAVVNGRPAISYHDQTNGDLKFIRANDANGTSWPGAAITVDSSSADTGEYTSLAYILSRPCISYYDAANGDLKYIRALDADGATWPAGPVTVDVTGTVGLYTSLGTAGSRPAISYQGGNALKFVRANDGFGTTWGAGVVIDSDGTTGLHTSLELVESNPAIAYYRAGSGDLKYIRALNVTGSSWPASGTDVDTAGDTGKFASLAIISGRPAIAYFDDGPNFDVKYVRAADLTGAAWAAPLTPRFAGSGGGHTSLAEVGGAPAISYFDAATGHLRYLR